MPSATSFPEYTLSNLGPLTTTYTPPASCATQSARTILAYNEAPNDMRMALSCNGSVSYDGCFPSGSAFDEEASRSVLTLDIATLLYYSPGLACPSDCKRTPGAVPGSGGEK